MSLSSLLPQPKNLYDNEEEHPLFQKQQQINKQDDIEKPKKQIPPYRKRKGYLPKTIDDFGDGGAFPEIHMVQYPLDMGRKIKSNKASGSGSNTSTALVAVNLQVDSTGQARHEAILGSKAMIHSTYKDLVPKQYTENDLQRPDDNEIQETLDRTKNALEKIVNGKIRSAKSTNLVDTPQNGSTYIKYTPSNQSGDGSTQSRIIRMVDQVQDPLEPPKYKIKKKIIEHGSPPPPVMHSPPRKLTVQEQKDWTIPPCISNWKNPKGFAISIDKRLASDGRGLQDVEINDKFAHFTQALYIAESNAREEVSARAELERKIAQKEKERKQEMLRKLAEDVRNERSGILQQRSQQYSNRKDSDSDSDESDSDSDDNRKDTRKQTTTTTTTSRNDDSDDDRRRDRRDKGENRRAIDSSDDSDDDRRRDRRDKARDRDDSRGRRDRDRNRDRDDSRDRRDSRRDSKYKNKRYDSSPSSSSDSDSEDERERRERDRIRMEKKRELEREYRLEASGKKSKLNRDQDRDISEKIALGQSTNVRTEDSIYDQRLFNQNESLSSGFGADDSYNVYSKPLFGGGISNSIYRPKSTQEDNTTVDDVLKQSRFGNGDGKSSKPHKEFSGTDRSKERSGPVAFEKEKKKSSDPFGFDDFSKKK